MLFDSFTTTESFHISARDVWEHSFSFSTLQPAIDVNFLLSHLISMKWQLIASVMCIFLSTSTLGHLFFFFKVLFVCVFWCWPFLKSLLNLLQYCFFFCPQGMWNCSSLTRDQTCTLCIGRKSLNHLPPRKLLKHCLYLL